MPELGFEAGHNQSCDVWPLETGQQALPGTEEGAGLAGVNEGSPLRAHSVRVGVVPGERVQGLPAVPTVPAHFTRPLPLCS